MPLSLRVEGPESQDVHQLPSASPHSPEAWSRGCVTVSISQGGWSPWAELSFTVTPFLPIPGWAAPGGIFTASLRVCLAP